MLTYSLQKKVQRGIFCNHQSKQFCFTLDTAKANFTWLPKSNSLAIPDVSGDDAFKSLHSKETRTMKLYVRETAKDYCSFALLFRADFNSQIRLRFRSVCLPAFRNRYGVYPAHWQLPTRCRPDAFSETPILQAAPAARRRRHRWPERIITEALILPLQPGWHRAVRRLIMITPPAPRIRCRQQFIQHTIPLLRVPNIIGRVRA